MPDNLYERDILSWSEHQAALLRCLERGERAIGIDWEHVVQEIEDVGRSELNAVNSHMRLMLVHLLQMAGWLDNSAVSLWREETATFQAEAVQRFTPSMRHRIDLDRLYAAALEQLGLSDYGRPPPLWPSICPLTLDMLLNDDMAKMENCLAASMPGAGGPGAAVT